MDDVEILTGDFRQLAAGLADDSIDAIVTDPPYLKEHLHLWEHFARMAVRVLKPGGNCIVQCGHEHLPFAFEALGQHLEYVWVLKENMNNGNARMWNKRIFVSYKPWLWYAKGKRNGGWVRDSANGKPDKRYHAWGDGVSFIRGYIERLTAPSDLVLDPFAGGGCTALACFQTGRRFIGYEIDAETADVARRRLESAQLPLLMPEATQLTLERINATS